MLHYFKIGNFIVLLFLIGLSILKLEAQDKTIVKLPNHQDAYSEFVKKLEAGQVTIDYKKFRESFIESRQFIVASKKIADFEKLKKEMHDQVAKSNYRNVIKITKAILSIDYTDMLAHKMLKQSYKILGDSINTKKYRAIEEGLIHSILKNNDGKSYHTAWKVIQLEEEKFILHHLGAKLINQSSESNHGIYDKMEVEVNGKKAVYYFEITKVFEGYKKIKDNQK